MNSQQELLDAINAITENKDKSFDTPATVIRVEDDTVWVHIDGGADETPVRKTINCEQGQTVQVRISNGSAFLVGNESAPPTDDKTANVAHFVAEQADIKAVKAEETATEVKETVEVLEVEVDGKVDIGTSNIQHMSSTMYQNANGVSIYNDTLAVGDSYAHIDGDSFDIKLCTTAGTIDDANDNVVASFGQESYLKYEYDTQYQHYIDYVELRGNGIKIGEIYNNLGDEDGWIIKRNGMETYGNAGFPIKIDGATGLQLGRQESRSKRTTIDDSNALFIQYEADGFNTYSFSEIDTSSIKCGTVDDFEATYYHQTEIENGNIRTTGDVYDYDDGYKKTPTVLTSTTISAATTSYTFTNAAITTDSVIDIYDDIFGFSPTAITVSTGSAVITFSAQASTHTIKLFVY